MDGKKADRGLGDEDHARSSMQACCILHIMGIYFSIIFFKSYSIKIIQLLTSLDSDFRKIYMCMQVT